jgi:outer membrane protein assembly factor BamB
MRLAALFLILPLVAIADDWPTYLHDASRSGITSEQLALPLKEAWVHRSPHKPRPAWRGPAKRDPYNKHVGLHNRQTFDHAYHAIAGGGAVFYGSSADDQLYCLDAKTGRVRWTFFSEGPIRLAPTLHNGRLFFGSDDGHVYCVTTGGKLIWKTRLGPRDYRIAGNGRIISAWPVRSGVLIDKGTAYAAGGMFPSEGVHICALGADTGKIQWRTGQGGLPAQTDLPAQGNLLMSDKNLYVAAGRANPVVYDRVTGKRLRTLGGIGGTDITLANDTVVVGPGKTGQLCLIPAGQDKVFTTFAGTHMIVTPERFLIHGAGEMRAINHPEFLKQEADRQQTASRIGKLKGHIKDASRGKPTPKPMAGLKADLARENIHMNDVKENLKACELWKHPSEFPDALILAGDTLLVGGKNVVVAFNVKDGRETWRHAVKGRALGLAVGNGQLLASTDEGVVHCFKAGGAR